ncbi:hypothetical protein T439DRAFT_324687, partial [Meredithblackwellia eburnea MCA 4105]
MPSATVDLGLPQRVAASFTDAVQQGHISLFYSSNTSRVRDNNLTHLIHTCPDLARKPLPAPKTPDLHIHPRRDPFEGPDFGKGEKVEDVEVVLSETPVVEGQPKAKIYSVVHNLHALAEEHFMAIPREFRFQTSDLLPEDLLVAWELVQAYEEAGGRELLCFFNGGPLAGASQSHLHMQFIPFQQGPPGPEELARSLPSPPKASRLPLPYLHLYTTLENVPTPVSAFSKEDPVLSQTIATSLHEKYKELLALAASYKSTVDESRLPPAGVKRASYNFFLTKNHMHLVPRTDRLVMVPRIESKDVRPGDEWVISINGLAYASYWYVGVEEEKRDLQTYGLSRVLVECAYDINLL